MALPIPPSYEFRRSFASGLMMQIPFLRPPFSAPKIFVTLTGFSVCLVLFFGICGPGIMNLLAAHDPDPKLRDRSATLASAHALLQNGLDADIPDSSLLALDHGVGPGRINCVIMGAKAEKAGRHAEAFLWFALDARARGMSDAVKAYEDEALRIASQLDSADRPASLDAILQSYSSLCAKLDAEVEPMP